MISFDRKTKSKDYKKDINLEDTDLQDDKIGARIKEVREAKGMGRRLFYKDITPHISNCIAIEHGKRKIGRRLSNEIIKHHHVNPEWLFTGEGDMFDEGAVAAKVIDPGVPFFNVNLSEISFESFSTLNEPPEYYVNYRPFNDCDAYLPIYGDSMYPKYASGEIIAVREIKNFEVIQWGEAYLLIADERANSISTVKLLFEHSNEKKIVLRSSNPNFKGDTVLDKEMIKRLFIVKGKVTRHQL
ncbi:XRE family transcriptional regulator [Pedobacter nyackensis]|uniref:XRE family transcriptional regulator n=1 Tax=Pedobacter nyackensis TaxID=475255 RepID=UPI00292D15A5|nr:S24 family peptidase [Pedobacter nyackensis]